jgi:hypothetical protein
VSSISGANIIFEGRQTKRGETEIEETLKRNRRGIKDADQGRSKKQIKRRTRTAPRHNVTGS